LTAKLPPFPAVDAKGRPLGYWGKFAGCRADLECEPSAEPPPEPHHFQWHAWSVKTLSAARGPLHTTEIVRGEVCWQLGGNTQPVHALLGLVRVGAIQLLHPWPGHLERPQKLMMTSERMHAADASLVV
jgi:hypothetical protein